MKTILELPFQIAKALVHQSEREFLLPRQIIARAAGLPLGEPTIIQIPQPYFLRDFENFDELQQRGVVFRPRGEQKQIYLGIISQMARALPEKFAEVAPKLRGNQRIYFGHSRSKVEGTGSSNEAARVPDTDWFASVNNGANRKASILLDLMLCLGFSRDYSYMIAWSPNDKFPRFNGIQFKSV
jgi:SeqA protein C-terminal domain